ncbi:hypothetical protein Tco_1228241 [Tanacetum coccineum]
MRAWRETRAAGGEGGSKGTPKEGVRVSGLSVLRVGGFTGRLFRRSSSKCCTQSLFLLKVLTMLELSRARDFSFESRGTERRFETHPADKTQGLGLVLLRGGMASKTDHSPSIVKALYDAHLALKERYISKSEEKMRVFSEKLSRCFERMEVHLARKDSALVFSDRVSNERAVENERLVSKLGYLEKEKTDSIGKLLPTVVRRLLNSHEYKESLYKDGRRGALEDVSAPPPKTFPTKVNHPPSSDSKLGYLEKEKTDSIGKLLPTVVRRLLNSREYKESLSIPFNLAIQAGWAKGLAVKRSEEDLMDVLREVQGFDPYSDTRMAVEYDKLFTKTYPFVEKISGLPRRTV